MCTSLFALSIHYYLIRSYFRPVQCNDNDAKLMPTMPRPSVTQPYSWLLHRSTTTLSQAAVPVAIAHVSHDSQSSSRTRGYCTRQPQLSVKQPYSWLLHTSPTTLSQAAILVALAHVSHDSQSSSRTLGYFTRHPRLSVKQPYNYPIHIQTCFFRMFRYIIIIRWQINI